MVLGAVTHRRQRGNTKGVGCHRSLCWPQAKLSSGSVAFAGVAVDSRVFKTSDRALMSLESHRASQKSLVSLRGSQSPGDPLFPSGLLWGHSLAKESDTA